MSKNSVKSYTSQNIANPKFFIALVAAVAVAVDVLITILLILGGYDLKFIIFPCLLAVLDAAYFAVGLFATNYRFKYSVGVWLSYVLFTAVACTVGTLLIYRQEGTVLTYIALGLWGGVHLFSVICTVFAALYASRRFSSTGFSVAVTLLFVAVAVFYGMFLLTQGFFGQGNGRRTLVYEYNESSDSYTVSGVLAGRSDTVVVDSSFNGKPVDSISCAIFTDSTVSEYFLYDRFKLVDVDELSNGSAEGKSVYVTVDAAAAMRAQLFECAHDAENRANALALANAAVPYYVEGNRSYVAFSYDEQAYLACGERVLPLIFADNGTEVSLSDYINSFEYLAHSDKTDVADLNWAYESGNGYILDGISADGKSLLDNYVIDGNVNAKVEFEKVYRVYVGDGNDEKYALNEKQTDFCTDSLNGNYLGYRYIAESNADSLLGEITMREGFGLSWKYSAHGSSSENQLTTLSQALKAVQGSEIDITPVWSLNAPAATVNGNRSITYGEDVAFTADAHSPAEGISHTYEWKHGITVMGSDGVLNLTTPSLSDGYEGEYVVTVTAVGGEVTSLTSSVTLSVNLTIAKKPISFGWELPDEAHRVYDGTPKRVTATFDNSQLVADDGITYYLNGTENIYADCLNAGDYKFTIALDEYSALDYEIEEGTGINSLTIDKCQVQVSWSDYSFTYNGLMQTPVASARGVFDEELVSTVIGGKISAGSYTATAVCNDGNYNLTENTLGYIIAKAPLTITAKDCEVFYGYNPVFPGVEYEGFVNGETQTCLGGILKHSFGSHGNADVYEDCVAVNGLSSDNYEITYVSGKLTVLPRPVTVEWSGYENLIYNAQQKNVTATVSNGVGNDDVGLTVTNGDKVNAGDYTAYVYSDALTGASKDNYTIAGTFSRSYTIAKAKVTITPNPVTVTYGDPEVELTATCGIIYNDDFTYTLTRDSGSSAGSYDITVNLSGDVSNYEVTKNTATYTISRRVVEIIWSGYENLVYDGESKNVSASLNNVIIGDDVRAVVTDGDKVNAGEHTATASLAGAAADNYSLPDVHTFSYTIERAELSSLAVSLADYVYGSSETPQVTGNSGNGAVSYKYGVTADFDSAFEATRLSVGEYYVFVSVAQSANYKSGVASSTFKVNPREVTLQWSGHENLVYDGQNKNVTAVLGNYMGGDDISVVITGGDMVNAGNYTATASLDGAAAGNYSLPENYKCAYTVERATPVLNGFTDNAFAVSEVVLYGTTLSAISSKLPVQNIGGNWEWADGDETLVQVGTYPYEVTFRPDSGNYNTVSAQVTVSAKKNAEFSAEFSGENLNLSGGGYAVELSGESASVGYNLVDAEELDGSLLSVKITLADGGTAQAVVEGNTITFNAVGSYKVTLIYGGDQTHFSREITYDFNVTAPEQTEQA